MNINFKKIIIIFYFLIISGFIFHTSVGKEQVFSKYSIGYFLFLIFFIISPLPLIIIWNYAKDRTFIKLNNKKLKLNNINKVKIVLVILLIVLAASELIFRLFDIKPQRTAYEMEFHPFLQKKLKKNIGMEFHINSFGFRNNEIKKVKDPSIYRIVILGGSTAYGDGVAYKHNSAKLLEDLLNKQYNRKVEVINAAVSGYTSEHSLIDYMTRISEFSPDLVIMWHGVNDMYAYCRDISSPNTAYEPDYSHILGPLGNMVKIYFNPPLINVNLYTVDTISAFVKTHLYSDFKYYWENAFYTLQNKNRERMPIANIKFLSSTSYKRNLEYFINAVKSDNVELILGNQPNMFVNSRKYGLSKDGLYCYDGNNRASLESQIKGINNFNNITKTLAKDNEVYFIDLDGLLPRHPEYFLDEIHWSDLGHELIADRLYKFIIDRNFIK